MSSERRRASVPSAFATQSDARLFSIATKAIEPPSPSQANEFPTLVAIVAIRSGSGPITTSEKDFRPGVDTRASSCVLLGDHSKSTKNTSRATRFPLSSETMSIWNPESRPVK